MAAGNGVFGLQRALHQAGARSVIASLWKVDDRATQTLMTEFYRNHWQGGLGKLAALRKAQLEMIARYQPQTGSLRSLGGEQPLRNDLTKLSPYYWAAFSLSGDWQ